MIQLTRTYSSTGDIWGSKCLYRSLPSWHIHILKLFPEGQHQVSNYIQYTTEAKTIWEPNNVVEWKRAPSFLATISWSEMNNMWLFDSTKEVFGHISPIKIFTIIKFRLPIRSLVIFLRRLYCTEATTRGVTWRAVHFSIETWSSYHD